MANFKLRVICTFSMLLTTYAAAKAEPKPGWRDAMTKQLVAHVCQGDGEWLKCFNRKPSECNQIITKTVGGCLESFEPREEDEKSTDALDAWEQQISGCVDRSFLAVYGQAKKTPECMEPPPHLR